MVRSVLLVVAFMAALSSSASATGPLRTWTIGSWEVAEHEKFCIGRSPLLRSGSTMLMFAMHTGDELVAFIGNPSWKMREKRVREVFVTIDRDYLGGFPTAALGGDTVAVRLPLHLMQGLQDGVRISMQFDRATLTFPLKHTRFGLETLVRCYRGKNTAVSADEGGRSTGVDAVPKREAPPVARSSSGSGFFVDGEGHIVTANHVIEECTVPRVRGFGSASVVRQDPSNDLAILKIKGSPKGWATFNDGDVVLAQKVLAIGYPLSQHLRGSLNVTAGMVSNLTGPDGDIRRLQISAPVQPGNSGGPLMDSYGNVVGVVTDKLNHIAFALRTGGSAENMAWALRTDNVRQLLRVAGVKPEIRTSSALLSDEEVAKEAGGFTVLIECLRR